LQRAAYDAIISACGRSGQLGTATALKQEMESAGMEPSPVTYLSLLHAMAEEGQLAAARRIWDEMRARGMQPGEPAYAAMLNCYRNLARKVREQHREREEERARGDKGRAQSPRVRVCGQRRGWRTWCVGPRTPALPSHAAPCCARFAAQAAEEPGVKESLLALLDEGLASAATDASWVNPREGEDVTPGLLVYNAALNSMVQLG
jgi:pentatricopeptide repeat protein